MSPVRIWATILATMLLTFAGFVIAVPAMRGAGFDPRSGQAPARPGAPVGIGLAMNLLILAGALWIYLGLTGRPVMDLGLRFGVADAAFVTVVVLVTAALAFGALRTTRTTGIVDPTPDTAPDRATAPFLQLLMATTLLVAGLQEEFIYRGVVVSLLLPCSWLLALLVSASLFTLVHFVTSPVTWHQAVNWFLGGVALFIIYVVSRSLLVVTAVHVARSLANSFLLFAVPGVSITAPPRPLSERTRLLYDTALSTIVTLLAVLWYARPA